MPTKLHNWYYYIILTIKKYSAINRFTTETYESLQKDSVKKPYRASNKCKVTNQMIKTVNIFILYILHIITLIK